MQIERIAASENEAVSNQKRTTNKDSVFAQFPRVYLTKYLNPLSRNALTNGLLAIDWSASHVFNLKYAMKISQNKVERLLFFSLLVNLRKAEKNVIFLSY